MATVGVTSYRVEEISPRQMSTITGADVDDIGVHVDHQEGIIYVSGTIKRGRLAKLVAEIATEAAIISLGVLPLLPLDS